MDWKTLVSTVAPWIGTALGGPLGGMAVGAVASALGLSDKTESAIKTALSGATPADMLALKNADQQFALQMQELGFNQVKDLEKIASDDRNSARQREMTVKDKIPAILAILVTFGFFVVLAIVMFVVLPTEIGQAMYILLGTLAGGWSSVLNYYFGSSSGSNAKNAIIERLKSTTAKSEGKE